MNYYAASTHSKRKQLKLLNYALHPVLHNEKKWFIESITKQKYRTAETQQQIRTEETAHGMELWKAFLSWIVEARNDHTKKTEMKYLNYD